MHLTIYWDPYILSWLSQVVDDNTCVCEFRSVYSKFNVQHYDVVHPFDNERGEPITIVPDEPVEAQDVGKKYPSFLEEYIEYTLRGFKQKPKYDNM